MIVSGCPDNIQVIEIITPDEEEVLQGIVDFEWTNVGAQEYTLSFHELMDDQSKEEALKSPKVWERKATTNSSEVNLNACPLCVTQNYVVQVETVLPRTNTRLVSEPRAFSFTKEYVNWYKVPIAEDSVNGGMYYDTTASLTEVILTTDEEATRAILDAPTTLPFKPDTIIPNTHVLYKACDCKKDTSTFRITQPSCGHTIVGLGGNNNKRTSVSSCVELEKSFDMEFTYAILVDCNKLPLCESIRGLTCTQGISVSPVKVESYVFKNGTLLPFNSPVPYIYPFDYSLEGGNTFPASSIIKEEHYEYIGIPMGTDTIYKCATIINLKVSIVDNPRALRGTDAFNLVTYIPEVSPSGYNSHVIPRNWNALRNANSSSSHHANHTFINDLPLQGTQYCQ